MPLDVLHNNNSVVHHNADSQYQAEQRKVVDRKTKREHGAKRADERHGHSRQRNNRRAPGLEENNNDNDHKENCLQQRVDDGLNRVTYKDRRVINHRVVHTVGKVSLQVLHSPANICRKLERVGAGRLKNRQGDSRLVVQQGAQRITACA